MAFRNSYLPCRLVRLVPENNQDIEIFSDLANPIRLKILQLLKTESSMPSRLSTNLEMTIQALQRHIDRLYKSGMVKKDQDGRLSLSSVGVGALEQIPFFLFLSKHRKYFQDHDFTGIPKHLIQRIGELNNCEFIDDVAATWQKAKNTAENCQEFMAGFSSLHPTTFYDVAKIQLQKGVKFRLGFPEYLAVSKGYYKKREESGWNEAIKTGQVEEFFVKSVPLTTVITEIEAELLFSNTKNGQTDGSAIFYSKDPDFRRWCLDLFDHYYKMERSNSPRIHEV